MWDPFYQSFFAFLPIIVAHLPLSSFYMCWECMICYALHYQHHSSWMLCMVVVLYEFMVIAGSNVIEHYAFGRGSLISFTVSVLRLNALFPQKEEAKKPTIFKCVLCKCSKCFLRVKFIEETYIDWSSIDLCVYIQFLVICRRSIVYDKKMRMPHTYFDYFVEY